jgi:hypothetical protein
MNINNPTGAAGIWNFAPRTLTGLGSSIIVNDGVITGTLAAGATAGFAPPAGQGELITIIGQAAGNVTWVWGLTNGTLTRQGTGAVTGVPINALAVSSTFVYPYLTNGGTVAGTYAFAILSFVQ